MAKYAYIYTCKDIAGRKVSVCISFSHFLWVWNISLSAIRKARIDWFGDIAEDELRASQIDFLSLSCLFNRRIGLEKQFKYIEVQKDWSPKNEILSSFTNFKPYTVILFLETEWWLGAVKLQKQQNTQTIIWCEEKYRIETENHLLWYSREEIFSEY